MPHRAQPAQDPHRCVVLVTGNAQTHHPRRRAVTALCSPHSSSVLLTQAFSAALLSNEARQKPLRRLLQPTRCCPTPVLSYVPPACSLAMVEEQVYYSKKIEKNTRCSFHIRCRTLHRISIARKQSDPGKVIGFPRADAGNRHVRPDRKQRLECG